MYTCDAKNSRRRWVCFNMCVKEHKSIPILPVSHDITRGHVDCRVRQTPRHYKSTNLFAPLKSPRETSISVLWHGCDSKDTQTAQFNIFLKLGFLQSFDAGQALPRKWPLTDGEAYYAWHSGTKSAELLLRPPCHHCHQCHRSRNAIRTQGCNKCASRLGMCATPVLDPTSLSKVKVFCIS